MSEQNQNQGQKRMRVQAVRVGLDGRLEVIDLGVGESTGAVIRAAIGCRWFDVVRLGRDLDMWIDDDGAVLADAQVNVVATAIARADGAIWQPFCGVAVFASHDRHGETVGLSERVRDALLSGAILTRTAAVSR
ncbi:MULTISPECIES: DUF3846 domain-containing protein [Rhodococcus]|uniref:DUF3846 domain-containing protein n=1 Tax=Rhodococcus TaxID=1827 RepID=UPI002954A474|nr:MULTISPECIES: hypothetical protein [Rhodococcus]MDV7246397.1 hypothetical protein [Rhodococcus oxybenzonivorans]MDV7337321.1 hypothetical protein [Rhodococcus oxybenzonivorans]MDV7348059.1 hypothetical protein [Rhodococcus oxybenzonivorans]MDV8031604.1 hypothetical protein [Rhodococcus sp. IEGM 27]MDV8107424.1 hypothetical protein [Rhodococcus sp. IEGM 69]